MSQPGTTAAAGPDSVRDEAEIRQVASASLLGSVVEWYDFFLYGTMAALVFNTEFFPKFDPLTGTLVAFGTFAAGFVTRPLGGLIFGHFGDRLGRKRMLVLTMLIMGLSTFAMGLLPNYASIGVGRADPAAPAADAPGHRSRRRVGRRRPPLRGARARRPARLVLHVAPARGADRAAGSTLAVTAVTQAARGRLPGVGLAGARSWSRSCWSRSAS